MEFASFIYFCGPCTIYEMRKSLRVRQRALYASLKVLLDLKWVQADRLHSFPRARTKTCQLSARGRVWMEPVMKSWSTLLPGRIHA